MRSSTLHRSNMSRERIAVLEELMSDNSKSYDSSPGIYVRSDKDHELDILWQGLKINPKDERTPGIYLLVGFATGIVCTLAMTAVLNFGGTAKDNMVDLNFFAKGNIVKKEAAVTPVNVAPATTDTLPQRVEKYNIQSGDTLEKVSIKFYGSSTPDKVMKIQTASKITDPNKISIGQELTIPIE